MVWFWPLAGKLRVAFLPRPLAVDLAFVFRRFPVADEERRRVDPVEARRFLVVFLAAFFLVVLLLLLLPVDARGVLARATRVGARIKALELPDTKNRSALRVVIKYTMELDDDDGCKFNT